jgi:Uma2 family endonuclease
MTVEEYFQTPETVVPQELIYGVMHVAESPTTSHQEAVGALFLALHAHLARDGEGTVWLAPLDVVLDVEGALVVQPDLFVLRRGGAAVIMEKVFGPPDLVVEVVSPTARIAALAERVGWFARYGVRECWLVDPVSHDVDVLQFKDGTVESSQIFRPEDAIVSSVLPGFAVSPMSILGYGHRL